jgi:putative SOS response-associated peptidase YedK
MFNARAETVISEPAYRDAFKHRRCLIQAEGFYEFASTNLPIVTWGRYSTGSTAAAISLA